MFILKTVGDAKGETHMSYLHSYPHLLAHGPPGRLSGEGKG